MARGSTLPGPVKHPRPVIGLHDPIAAFRTFI